MPKPPAPEILALAEQLAETDAAVLQQLTRAVQVLGLARVQAAVQEAQKIEAAGGQYTANGQRRRTLGGVFFQVLRQTLDKPTWQRIHGQSRPAPKKEAAPALPWEARNAPVAQALTQPGAARRAAVVLVGRPTTVKLESAVVVLTLAESGRLPALPAGVPVPLLPTTYKIIGTLKQWRKVEAALRDPQDGLVVEGYAFPYPKQKLIVVLAQRLTTKFLQTAQKKAAATP